MGTAAEPDRKDRASAIRPGDRHELCPMARAGSAAVCPAEAGAWRTGHRCRLRQRLCQPERLYRNVPPTLRKTAIRVLSLGAPDAAILTHSLCGARHFAIEP